MKWRPSCMAQVWRMVLGCGVDIVRVSHLEQAVQRWGDKFLSRVYTPRELAYGQGRSRKFEFFAARFAAKEAVIKAFGEWRGNIGLPLQAIEVLADAAGRPVVKLSGAALQLKHRSRATDVMVSLSHTDDYAVASAIVVKRR